MSDFYRPITKYETDGETMRKRVQLENWFSPGRASSILRIKYYRNLTLPLLPYTVSPFAAFTRDTRVCQHRAISLCVRAYVAASFSEINTR